MSVVFVRSIYTQPLVMEKETSPRNFGHEHADTADRLKRHHLISENVLKFKQIYAIAVINVYKN